MYNSSNKFCLKFSARLLFGGVILALAACGENVTNVYMTEQLDASNTSSSSQMESSSASLCSDDGLKSSLVTEACSSLTFVTTEHLNQKMLEGCEYGTLLDERDCQVYRTVTIGEQTWMAQNLNYLPKSGTTYCYDDDDSYCDKYGRLYVRAAVSCPDGWHLPDDSEWETLFKSVGGQSKAAAALRASTGWEEKHSNLEDEDSYGFSALPSGVYYFGDEGNTGWFFSATDHNDFSVGSSDGSSKSTAADYTAISVRCVKN